MNNTPAPVCTRDDCFANMMNSEFIKRHACSILKDAVFTDRGGSFEVCPFFKTVEQYNADLKKYPYNTERCKKEKKDE